LEDSITAHDASELRIEIGLVERMRHGSDQKLGGVTRQYRVGIEGDYIPDAARRICIADDHRKCISRLSTQKPVELAELSTFPLPSHPHALLFVPQSLSMKEVEHVTTMLPVFLVELFDSTGSCLDDLRVFRPRF